jgi:hypothetical protein
MRAANYRIDALVNERFRSFKADMARYSVERNSPTSPFLSGSFSVTRLDEALGSIRFNFSSYSGGAHGSHWTESCNFFLAPYSEFDISGLFLDPSSGLSRLSQLCVEKLLGLNFLDKDSVLIGAAPAPENYRSFNISQSEILVYFNEYQVGPYAVGQQDVAVPISAFSDLMVDRIQ